MNATKQNDRKQRVNCQHCGKVRTGNRPRGLCWTCYYTPTVRDLYPADPRYVADMEYLGVTHAPLSEARPLVARMGGLRRF